MVTAGDGGTLGNQVGIPVGGSVGFGVGLAVCAAVCALTLSCQTVASNCDITWRRARPFLHFLVSAHSTFDLDSGLVRVAVLGGFLDDDISCAQVHTGNFFGVGEGVGCCVGWPVGLSVGASVCEGSR
jgi:hypothetical protein